MPRIEVATVIHAPAEICFDLARDVDLHVKSTSGTNERAIGGVTAGLMNLGDEVTWEATHLGVTQRLTSRITALDRPRGFRDSQVRGPFARFDHDHLFKREEGATVMVDVFDYTSPLWFIGRFADLVFLRRYLERFLRARARVIKDTAEQTYGFGGN
ncbi:MAG: SRPBCC family protein [Bryobacteraceae bacterium]